MSIPHIPPPWHLTGTIYLFCPPTLTPGLSMIQILRFPSSPVGPYDEMLVVPGLTPWSFHDATGKIHRGNNPRITEMYVSQKHTCYNGRINWNCPKQIAHFSFTNNPNGSTTIQVTTTKPIFRATFTPIPYIPSFPFATRWPRYLGFETTLVQPPLPAGDTDELPGTECWMSFAPQQYSRNCMVGWFDVSKDPDTAQADENNTSSSLGKWQLGMKMVDADLRFDVPTVWREGTKAKL